MLNGSMGCHEIYMLCERDPTRAFTFSLILFTSCTEHRLSICQQGELVKETNKFEVFCFQN